LKITVKDQVTTFLKGTLAHHGDLGELLDDESLFLSGRLDSLSMLNLIMFLEKNFSMNFSEIDFDVDLVDSIDNIILLIDRLHQSDASNSDPPG
jgi:acyl carrier protein